MNVKSPIGVWLLAGASSVALAVVGMVFSTTAVQADARLPMPASAMPPPGPSLSVPGASVAPKKAPRVHLLNGIASWYGSVLNGHRTASGERFDMYAMTACHPTLPFGTLVRVHDLKNQKSVVVRINDRGILSTGRIIDLSYAAARELNITKSGLAPVKLEVIAMGKNRKP